MTIIFPNSWSGSHKSQGMRCGQSGTEAALVFPLVMSVHLAFVQCTPLVRPDAYLRHRLNSCIKATHQISRPARSSSPECSKIKILDTTLRDGELSPGVSFTVEDKLEIAQQLHLLGVDVIEAGFPAMYPSDRKALYEISRQVGRLPNAPHICALCRANESDVQLGFESIQHALHPRIHTFVSTSRLPCSVGNNRHAGKLLRTIEKAVKFAKSVCADVEFSAADAFQTDRDLLLAVIDCALRSGATTISIPHTRGTCLPSDVSSLFADVQRSAAGASGATFSVHAHNDLGLAVANSLCAVQHGCRQVEVSVNGIGARAGNASLEEVVMALTVRKEAFYGALGEVADESVGELTNIRKSELLETSLLVAKRSGMVVQANKAIVGANAKTFIRARRS